jgi:hypothetical protein
MFIPNTTASWCQQTHYNEFGEMQWAAPVDIPCASVEVIPKLTRSPIRSEASASHSNSDELDIQAIILVPPEYPVKIDDRFLMNGLKMRIISVQSQNNVLTGDTDHYEIGLEAIQE